MGKLWSFIKSIFFAAKVVAIAVTAPVIKLVTCALRNQPIKLGDLLFAFWRLFVWLFFVICATTSVGVPPTIALLFLIDLAIVGVQIVGVAVFQLKEEKA